MPRAVATLTLKGGDGLKRTAAALTRFTLRRGLARTRRTTRFGATAPALALIATCAALCVPLEADRTANGARVKTTFYIRALVKKTNTIIVHGATIAGSIGVGNAFIVSVTILRNTLGI